MFDEALQKFNDKQKRKDRIIPNYYEHIRTGHQEKPFTEVVVQIGNTDDTLRDAGGGACYDACRTP